MQALVAPLVPEFNAGILSSSFVVKLDNTLTIAQLKATGNYHVVNRNINDEKFPVPKYTETERSVECVIMGFPFYVEEKRVNWEMGKNGCRLGNIQELMTASEQYPDMELPLVAMGSVWENSNDTSGNIHLTSYVPYLWKNILSKKGLSVNWLRGGWGPKFKFLGVKI